jgi:aspartate-semialdehyde dehydrogenase
VFIGHSIALNVELDSNVTKEQIISIFSDQDHTFYQRDIITPKEIVKIDEVVVSRVRVNKNYPSIVDLWLCSDNLRKGAALNAVQIAEHIVSEE